MAKVVGYQVRYNSYYRITLVDEAEQQATTQLGLKTDGYIRKPAASAACSQINNLGQKIRSEMKKSRE